MKVSFKGKIFLQMSMALSLFLAANSSLAYQIQLEPTMKVDGQELKINGQGVRTKFGFDIYLGGLYLPDLSKAQAAVEVKDAQTKDVKAKDVKDAKSTKKDAKLAKDAKAKDKQAKPEAPKVIKLDTPEQIIMADEVMGIRLYIMSSLVNGSRMADATLEGFQKATNNNLGNLQGRVDKILEAFRSGVKKNTFADLVYRPNKGTEVILSGKSVMTIEGLDFKQALFRIWLGNDPIQESLRNEMLGDKK